MPNKEFAPGIPSDKKIQKIPSVSEPKIWDVAIQEHKALKAGKHFDVRLVDPETGYAHSWAARDLPEPGKSVYVHQQPTHSAEYSLGFSGKIPEGTYGAGQVTLAMKEKAEVLRANNDKVIFNVFQGRGSDEYALIRMGTGKVWKLMNRTATRETNPDIPDSKPKYKETSPEDIDFNNKDQIMMAKIDGAHVSIDLKPGKDVKVFSYRPTERKHGVIEHTRRFQDIENVKSPKSLGETMVRGELYAWDPKTDKAVDAKDVGAILNSSVLKSREKQNVLGKIRAAIFDVIKFKGKDYSQKPYEEKLIAIKQIVDALPGMEIPRMALEPKDKARLLSDIEKGREPSTREGVVLWPLAGSGLPIKAKLKEEHDVYIRKIFGGERAYKKDMAGGFEYSHTPNGPIVGKVGTGFSERIRRDMWENPDKYTGLIAKVNAQEKFESGALRAPSFQMLHLDNPGDRLAEVEKVASGSAFTKKLTEAVLRYIKKPKYKRVTRKTLSTIASNSAYIKTKIRGI